MADRRRVCGLVLCLGRMKMKNRLDTDGLAVMMFLVVTVTLIFLERLS